MEMNRYLIAALYVMAGCAVTIPLKAQGNAESFRGERCRLVITNTVKVVSVYIEETTKEQIYTNSLLPDYFHFPKLYIYLDNFSLDTTVWVKNGSLCPTSHKIRAPEMFFRI